MPFNWPFHYFGWHFFHIVTAITTNGTFALTLTQADDMFCEKIKTEFRTTKQRSSCWLKIVIHMEYSEDRSSFNRSKNVLNYQPQHMPYYTACVPARAEGDHMMRRIWNACVIRMIWIVNLNGRASMIFQHSVYRFKRDYGRVILVQNYCTAVTSSYYKLIATGFEIFDVLVLVFDKEHFKIVEPIINIPVCAGPILGLQYFKNNSNKWYLCEGHLNVLDSIWLFIIFFHLLNAVAVIGVGPLCWATRNDRWSINR